MKTPLRPLALVVLSAPLVAQSTQKPPLHGQHWIAITGKPLAATAGAMVFQQGGNAVDAACAMLAATCTMWDVLAWGGETQALIHDPRTGEVIGINGLGVAPTGATAEFFRELGHAYPPEYGPLAAVTPGTPGALCMMLSEFGTMSLAQVLAPAMELAEGYPIEAQTADSMERHAARIAEWPYSKAVFLPHAGEAREAPRAGELFRQPDLLDTLRKLVEAERQALEAGKSREEAIQAAYDRFYTGDIAREFVRGCQEQGGLITLDDLARWRPRREAPLSIDYKGIRVFKLAQWTQGPMMLQALELLEGLDLVGMGFNSAKYVHTLCQVLHMAFADRDFYYGDPAFAPDEPIEALLSEDYAAARRATIDWERNDPHVGPGDPYPFVGASNPYLDLLRKRREEGHVRLSAPIDGAYLERVWAGTTTVQAADAEGWVVSMTPSGGWIPACIAGRTGIGMSQRMQSFVLDPKLNPFNVVEPGKRPRVTLTPTLATKDGKPFLSFAAQGGDTQDQNLLQFFLDVVEFGMTVQEACEAPNVNTYQYGLSLGGEDRSPRPGLLLLHEDVPPYVRKALVKMGYQLTFGERTSGPINAIFFDREHGTLWGGSSNHGEDHGIAW